MFQLKCQPRFYCNILQQEGGDEPDRELVEEGRGLEEESPQGEGFDQSLDLKG